MGLFNNLLNKIFSHASQVTTPTAASGSAPQTPGATQPAGAPAQTAGGAAPQQQVDINAVLEGLAAKNSEKLDWKHSIVDLMKLVGMDSSLSARKELAQDLHYTGDMNDSATMNMWLSKEVMQKLQENGGKVPSGLQH